MLKIRLMGTKNDITWFKKIMQRHPKIEVLELSDLYLAHRELVDTEGAQSLFLCCRSLYIYRHGPEAQRWTPKES